MNETQLDIRDLYQELIIDHGTHPRNFCKMHDADCSGEGYNPLCGDQVSIYIQYADADNTVSMEEDLKIKQVTFQGKGCAISMASASLLTEAVLGKSIFQAIEFSKAFQALLTIDETLENSTTSNEIHLGKLAALAGVKAFPARVKCATLAWHALLSALQEGVIPSRLTLAR